MRTLSFVAGLILGGLAPQSEARQLTIGGMAIAVPAVFEGPVIAEPDTRVRTQVFTAGTTSPLLAATVLQVTVYDAAVDLKDGGDSDVAERYLLRMLRGVERRRTDYEQTPPTDIFVAGLPGSVVSWKGKANGINTNGRMFCIVATPKLLFFHVMGSGNVPNADMQAAIKAVESARKY